VALPRETPAPEEMRIEAGVAREARPRLFAFLFRRAGNVHGRRMFLPPCRSASGR